MAERRPRGPYTGPGCPRCGMPLDNVLFAAAGEQVCPACSRPFLARAFSPPGPRAVAVASVLETGPGEGVACGRHAGNAAVGNCTRCGVFMCGLCRIEIDGMELCPSCFDRLSAEGVLSSARTRIRDYRGLSLSLGVFGCLLYFFGLITGPATIWFAWKGFRQRRELNERGGALSLLLAVGLGLIQIASTLFLIWAVVSEGGA